MRLFIPALTALVLLASASLSSADTVTQSIREFTSKHAPQATAAQAREFGLFLPDKIDPSKPVVVLVHGLDMDQEDWNAMSALLKGAGQQVGWFDYPSDQPISDDVKLLADRMALVRKDRPGLKVDLVGFSMGSLVCRAYVEGEMYAGGVDRLILLSPPNHGSSWARFGVLLKCEEQIHQVMYDDNWEPSWIITSGLCEADCDLKPGSPFLTKLNALPRRAGVRYTVVEGDEHIARRMTADWIAAPVRWVPDFASQWWGIRQMAAELIDASTELNSGHDCSDGPVKLTSADLEGVSDVVRVHADHTTMIQPHQGQAPMAWSVLKDRLGIHG